MNVERIHPVGKDLDRVSAGEHAPVECSLAGLFNRDIQLSQIVNRFDADCGEGQRIRSPPDKRVDQRTGLPAGSCHHDARALEVFLCQVHVRHSSHSTIWHGNSSPISACKHAAISAA